MSLPRVPISWSKPKLRQRKEFTWKFYPENTDSPRQLNAIRKGNKNHLKKDYVSNPAPQLSARNGLNLCWQPLLAGGGTATAWKEIRKENTSTLIVSNAHSFPGTEALQKAETALASLQEADLPCSGKHTGNGGITTIRKVS